MRYTLVLGTALVFAASAAMAQTQTAPAANGPQNSAINSGSSQKQVEAPVKGANSFTEGEARSRIMKNGFSDLTGLRKDDNGIWRGTAMKDGRKVEVSLDYQGNVVTR